MKLVKKLLVVALPLVFIAGCASQEDLDKANQSSAVTSATAEKAANAAAMAAKSAEKAAKSAAKSSEDVCNGTARIKTTFSCSNT